MKLIVDIESLMIVRSPLDTRAKHEEKSILPFKKKWKLKTQILEIEKRRTGYEGEGGKARKKVDKRRNSYDKIFRKFVEVSNF